MYHGILGAIIGDVVGRPFKFHNTHSTAFELLGIGAASRMIRCDDRSSGVALGTERTCRFNEVVG